jgi:hypothetical protein
MYNRDHHDRTILFLPPPRVHMKDRPGRKTILVIILAAVLITLLSYTYRWYDDGVFGTECLDPAPDGKCYTPILRAGFPFAYVIDSSGVSVMGVLSPLGEDRVFPLAFLGNIAVYALLIYGAWCALQEIILRLRR